MPCGFVALPSCHDKPNYHAGTVSTALLRVVRTPLQLTIWLNCLAQGLYRVPADQIQSTINRHVMQAGTHTYTQQRDGGGEREGTRTASHSKQRGNKRKNNEGRQQVTGRGSTQQSRQNKERKRRERGEKKHTGTRPWHAEEQTAQSRTGNKAKTQQRDNWSRIAQGRNKHTPEGVGGREGSARREEGKERGGNQAMHRPVRGPTNHILSNLWRNIVWPTWSRTNWGKVVWWIVS